MAWLLSRHGITSLRDLLEVLAFAVAIAGAVWAFGEYKGFSRAQKVQRAMDYVGRFSSDEMLQSRAELYRVELCILEKLAEPEPGIVQVATRERDAALRFWSSVDAALKLPAASNSARVSGLPLGSRCAFRDEDPERHVVRVVEFLSEAALCATLDVCDRETIGKLFSSEAQRIFPTYLSVICPLRAGMNGEFGQPLESFFVTSGGTAGDRTADPPCTIFKKFHENENADPFPGETTAAFEADTSHPTSDGVNP